MHCRGQGAEPVEVPAAELRLGGFGQRSELVLVEMEGSGVGKKRRDGA